MEVGILKTNRVELPKTGLSENWIPLKTEHLVLFRNIPLYIQVKCSYKNRPLCIPKSMVLSGPENIFTSEKPHDKFADR